MPDNVTNLCRHWSLMENVRTFEPRLMDEVEEEIIEFGNTSHFLQCGKLRVSNTDFYRELRQKMKVVKIKKSRIGDGLFTMEECGTGDVITEFRGQVISKVESWRRELLYMDKLRIT